MADDIAKFGLEMDSSGVIKGTRALDDLETQSGKTERATDKMGNSAKGMGGKMLGAAAAVGAVAAALKFSSTLVEVNTEFDRLEAALETVTGSSVAATTAFDTIKDFAKTTPFQLTEVTDSFIKLKALGLDPSSAALRSYGNTASGMGKSLNQMIEAVADATTGEFERLKEFGIKASVEGDQVSLRFRGVTTTIGNNAAEIEGYLRQIGNVQFAGGMERQMDTLGGAASNLEDSFDNLTRAIGEGSGFNSAVKSAQGVLSDLFNTITEAIEPAPIEQLGDRLAGQLLEAEKELLEIQADRFDVLEMFGVGPDFEERQAAAKKKIEAIKNLIIQSSIQLNEAAIKAGDKPDRKDAAAVEPSIAPVEVAAVEPNIAPVEVAAAAVVDENIVPLRSPEEDLAIQQAAMDAALDAHYQYEIAKSIATEQESMRRKQLLSAEIGAAGNVLTGLSQLMAKEGKKQNATQKILARAGIIASTAQAVMNALAVPPYPLGLTLAAGAALTGAQQLKAVGGGGGGGGGGGMPSLSSPSGFNQDSLSSNVAPTQAPRQTVINISGPVLAENLDQIISDSMRRAADTDNLIIEVNGQRAVIN